MVNMNSEAIERASELDRVYFEQHPGETEYVRPIVPGEFPPEVDANNVMVTQVTPGIRVRVPVSIKYVLNVSRN